MKIEYDYKGDDEEEKKKELIKKIAAELRRRLGASRTGHREEESGQVGKCEEGKTHPSSLKLRRDKEDGGQKAEEGQEGVEDENEDDHEGERRVERRQRKAEAKTQDTNMESAGPPSSQNYDGPREAGAPEEGNGA